MRPDDRPAATPHDGAAAAAGAHTIGLKRTLGFTDLVAYGLAYIAPIAPLSTLGLVWQASHGMIALSYLIGGVCMIFTALSYAVMSREVTTAGSVYGFARTVLGPFAGFMAGWMILLDYLLVPAFVYVVMSVGLTQLMPGVDRAVWIVLLVAFTFGVNWFGVRSTSAVSFASVIGQVAVAIALILVAVAALSRGLGAGRLSLSPLYVSSGFSLQAVLAGASICVMSFLGFDAISTLAEDARDPTGGALGRAILTVLGLATALFVLMTFVLGDLMQGMRFKSLDAAAYELAAVAAGPWAGAALAWFYALAVGFTNALPMQVGVARVLYAMGRDRQLPKFLALMHPAHNTPWAAMVVSTLVSLAVALWMRNDMDRLASIVNFGALTGFVLLHVSVVVHFAVRGGSRRWLIHLISPALGISVVGAVLTGMNPLALKLGLAWLAIGAIYGLYLNARGRAAAALGSRDSAVM